MARRAWLIDQYKEQNGFVPFQIELGNTTSSSSDFNFIRTEALYKLFETIKLDAVLIDDTELRDLDHYFIDRLGMKTPNVLSNVAPKNSETEYAKLKQHHSIPLGQGINLYIINIIDPARFKSLRADGRYDIIEPDDFLRQFSSQISNRDILIARLSIKDTHKMRAVLESPEASRIDLALISYGVSSQFLEEHENELSKSFRGWIPKSQPQPPPQLEEQPPAFQFDDEPSLNQGGKVIVDLNIDNRQFMDITNKFNAIPEPRSSEFIREVHFDRGSDGKVIIKVADIIVDRKLPADEEIHRFIEEIEENIAHQRQKGSINTRLNNIEREINHSRNNPYVGVSSCKDCHPDAYAVWENSAHAKALNTLRVKNEHDNPNCLSCHLTQWKQPSYFTTEWNFDPMGNELGCESCHGAGLPHINLVEFAGRKENENFWDHIKSIRPQLLTRNLTVEALSTCLECHDSANSPNFNFITYWEKIEHHLGEIEESMFSSEN